MMDQDILGAYRMCQSGHYLPSVVAEFNGHVNGIFRHGNQEDILKAPLFCLGFGIGKPFLEKGGEGVLVDDLLRTMPAYDNLAVAFHRHFCQPAVLPVPSRHHVQLVHIDALGLGIARKNIVNAKRGITEKCIELLRITR